MSEDNLEVANSPGKVIVRQDSKQKAKTPAGYDMRRTIMTWPDLTW
jgi:hypothetical protein